QQSHPDVTAAALRAFEAVRAAGKPVGVNAFDPAVAQSYVEAGADFIAVGADVALLARGTEALAARWSAGDGAERASY
ncbi:MAG: 2-dehydro-3-deoxyglucarate aldolase, partial [Propionibacterium sp.]|nr:2-dehydro-3-deoxyglucarate aldolase [Propionibacterium sp.]